MQPPQGRHGLGTAEERSQGPGARSPSLAVGLSFGIMLSRVLFALLAAVSRKMVVEAQEPGILKCL